MQKATTHAPGTKVDVKVPVDLAGNKYAQTVGGKAGERDIEQHNMAQTLADQYGKLLQVGNILDSGEPLTGLGSEVQLQWQRAKQLIMQDPESAQKVKDSELLDALLGSDVFPMIKQLGIGARGLDTPEERKFLISVMTGMRSMNKETLKEMTKLRTKYVKKGVESWNKRVESGELDNYFKSMMRPKRKIELPEAPKTQVRAGTYQGRKVIEYSDGSVEYAD